MRAPVEDALKTADVARRLQVDPCTIWRWRKRDRSPLPCHTIGRRVFYIWSEVIAWIATHGDEVRVVSRMGSA